MNYIFGIGALIAVLEVEHAARISPQVSPLST